MANTTKYSVQEILNLCFDATNNALKTSIGTQTNALAINDASTSALLVYNGTTWPNTLTVDTINNRVGIGGQPTTLFDMFYGDFNFTPLPPPTACTADLAGLGAGNLSNGSYTYRLTFVTNRGETTVSSNSTSVAVTDNSTNGQITLTGIPVSALGAVTGRNIYRTQANGAVYTFVATIADNTTTTYTDNIADATILNNAAPSSNNQASGWIRTGQRSMLLTTVNTYVGTSAGVANTSGTSNVFLGNNAGLANTSGVQNTFAGFSAGAENTSGSLNTAFGFQALSANTTGTQNTAVGYQALKSTTTANGDTATGYLALRANTTGNNNTAMGELTLFNNTTGVQNTAVGPGALEYQTTANNNTAMGHLALFYALQSDNTAVGSQSGISFTQGGKNQFFGELADLLAPGDTAAGGTPMTGAKSNGTANLGVGLYNYFVTFTIGGTETGMYGTISVTTDSSNKEVTLSAVPLYSGPMTGTVNRKIYRTTVGGLTVTNVFGLVTTLADNTTTSFVDTVADGSLGATPNAVNNTMALGYGAKAHLSNELVIGSNTTQFTHVYIGGGKFNNVASGSNTAAAAAGTSFTLHASGAGGSNSAGGNMTLAPGQGTGTGAGGDLIIQTAVAGSTASTWNALSTMATFKGDAEQNLILNNFIKWGGQSRVSTQFDKAANTTLGNITGLTVNVVAGKTYYFEAILYVTADATGGQKYAIAGTATATAITYDTLINDFTALAVDVASRSTSLATSVAKAGNTNTVFQTRINGTITVNAAGTLTAQFAQNSASGTSSVLVGSTFIVNAIA